MNIASKQVHMAWFGPIIAQNRSHRLWEASGMPPGPQNPPKLKNPGFRGLGGQAPLFPYFPSVGKLELLLQGVAPLLKHAWRGPCNAQSMDPIQGMKLSLTSHQPV